MLGKFKVLTVAAAIAATTGFVVPAANATTTMVSGNVLAYNIAEDTYVANYKQTTDINDSFKFSVPANVASTETNLTSIVLGLSGFKSLDLKWKEVGGSNTILDFPISNLQTTATILSILLAPGTWLLEITGVHALGKTIQAQLAVTGTTTGDIPTPLPGAIVLFGSALAGIGLMRSRRRSRLPV